MSEPERAERDRSVVAILVTLVAGGIFLLSQGVYPTKPPLCPEPNVKAAVDGVLPKPLLPKPLRRLNPFAPRSESP